MSSSPSGGAPADHPRERLARHGKEPLGDAELLALVLGSGRGGESARDVAGRLLHEHGGLLGLAACAPEELCATRGVGAAGSASVVAALEIGRRVATRRLERGAAIRSPDDIFQHFHSSLRLAAQERFLALLLDGRHRVCGEVVVSQGTLTASLVHPREVFRPALRSGAAALILVHNHPSGDPSPSQEDRDITDRLVEAGALLGVAVLDHVIVAERGYCSLREEGLDFCRGSGRNGGDALTDSCPGSDRSIRERHRWRSPGAVSRVARPRGSPGRSSSMRASDRNTRAYLDRGGEERRQSDRVEMVVRVEYKTVDELFTDFARNINEGGIFVETESPPPVGDPVALQFRIPGAEEPVQVTGHVVRLSDGLGHEPPGMGISFDALDARAQEMVNELVRSLRASTKPES